MIIVLCTGVNNDSTNNENNDADDASNHRRIHGVPWGCTPPLFLQSLIFFGNNFEELQTVLFEVTDH